MPGQYTVFFAHYIFMQRIVCENVLQTENALLLLVSSYISISESR